MNPLPTNDLSFGEHETFLASFTDGPKGEKGQLLFHIDIPDNPGAEDSIAQKVWRALHDTFFNGRSDDQYYCFEEALKAANAVIQQEGKKREQGTIGRIHSMASLLDGMNLHFSQIGEAVVHLKRGKHYSRISDDPEEGSTFSNISSGELAADDYLVFSTRPLPFTTPTALELFEGKASRINSQIKSIGKNEAFVGLISYVNVNELAELEEPEPLIEELIEESEKEETAQDIEQQVEEIEAEIEAQSPESKKRKKKGKAAEKMKQFASKISGAHFQKASEAVKGVFSGVGSRIGKVIKKPESLKNVNRRYILVALILLVLVFGVLMSWHSNYTERTQQAQHYEQLLSQVKNNISIAENRFLIGEKKDATEYLNKAALALQEIEGSNFYQNDVGKLKNDIQVYRDSFDAIIRSNDPNIYIDLSQKGTVDATGIITTQEQKNFIYEPRRLFESLLDKLQEPLTIDAEEIVIAGAELEDFNVLAFITQSGQVVEYSIRNGRFDRASTSDDTWKRGIDIKTFNGEFIYLLDPPSNSIWKYRRLRNGYSSAVVYSAQGDLSNAVSMAIDGDIYVLLRDGTMLRYRRGELQSMAVKSGPSVPLKNPSKIFTISEAKNVYVLDSALKRVVVYEKLKDGNIEYAKQVVFDGLKANELRDFFVDKDEQKLIVLTADKVYIADL